MSTYLRSVLTPFDTSGLAHATKVGVDQLTTHQDETQYRALLEWLSPAAFAAQQSDIFRGCQEGTGQWLLESQEYKVLVRTFRHHHLSFDTAISVARLTPVTFDLSLSFQLVLL